MSAQNTDEKRAADVQASNKYPLKYLRSLGDENLLEPLVVQGDSRPFFVASKKRRICAVPECYMLPLVVDGPVEDIQRLSLHTESFVLTTRLLTDEKMSMLGADLIEKLQKLGIKPRFELDDNGALPMMEKVDGFARKLPVLTSDADDRYTEKEVVLRYFPSLVAGEKELSISESATISATDDANSAKISPLCSLYTMFLFDIDLSEIPETGTEEARSLWETKVRKKLFIVAADECDPGEGDGLPKSTSDGSGVDFALFYTISMPEVKHTVDHFDCQGQRKLEQADLRMVNEWIKLTGLLVGVENVPAAANVYRDALTAKNSRISNFDTVVLTERAEQVCSTTWPSLKEQEERDVNAKGVTVYKMTSEKARATAQVWKDKAFSNPSIDMLLPDGTMKAKLVFYSDENERAMFGEMFTRADFRDAAAYTAAEFKKNLVAMASVYKALAYVNAGKQPPSTIVVHDSDQAAAASKRGRKRKGKEPTTTEVQSTSNNSASIEAVLNKISETLDTFMVDTRNWMEKMAEDFDTEAKRSAKFRKFVRERLPDVEGDDVA